MNKIFKLTLTVASSLVLFSSCLKKGEENVWIYEPNALVTVKTAEDGACFLQLDDKTTLLPENIRKSPYKSQPRALAALSLVEGDATPYDKLVHVYWMDSVLTKKAVMTSGEDDKVLYGEDRIEIYDNWVTVLEDGYLTIQFIAMFGTLNIPHHINLVMGVDPEDPYVLELRHDAKGDYNGCLQKSGIAAFDISSLPDTQGKTVKVTVKYRSMTGDEKTAKFDYCTGGIVKAEKALSVQTRADLDIR